MSILFILFGGKANLLLMNKSRVRVAKEVKLQALHNLAQPVTDLYVTDNFPELLDKPRLAIVGSRKVTPYGRSVTIQLAQALARVGVVIVSGLAIGVDSIAHQAVLDAGGLTIAVLPSSLDRIYPAHHGQLAQRIVQQGGALVSEYPEGSSAPMKHQFIARNRIIAALSQGVLITEAATKSGSLHTANFALESGLEVFAVPGNITSPMSAGTNNLIKTGATPVTDVQDILEALGINSQQSRAFIPNNLDEAAILQALKEGPQATNVLVQVTTLSPAIAQSTLSMLEIAGAVQQTSSGLWQRT